MGVLMVKIFWSFLVLLEVLGAAIFFNAALNRGLAQNLAVSAWLLGGFCSLVALLIGAKELVPVKYRLK